MKKIIALLMSLCLALTAAAAPPKKDDRGRGKDRKTEKEMPEMTWNVTVEGATADTAAEEVKAFLSAMKDVKVVSAEIKDKTVEAVISSRTKISRSDVSKALKEKKEFKVKEFKLKRPDKDEKKEKTDKDGEKEEPKKEESPKDEKKTGEKKTDEKKS